MRLLIIVVAMVAPFRLYSQSAAVVFVDRANVRESPTVDAAIVGTLAKGTSVTIVERRDTWTRVTSSTANGWIRTNMLTVSTSSGASATRAAAPSPSPAHNAAPPTTREVVPEPPSRTGASPARNPAVGSFDKGALYAGAHLWAGSFGTVPIEGTLEFGATEPGEMGPGIVAFSVGVAFMSGGGATIVPITGLVNYHFPVPDRRFDPYAGGGISYVSVSSTYLDCSYCGTGTASVLDGGLRYFLSPTLGLDANLLAALSGGGGSVTRLGITFKL